MNSGQEQFLNFILERVRDTEKEQVKQFMESNFEKQMAGTFGMAEIEKTKDFLKDVVKPEYRGEVWDVMRKFASNFAK